MERYAALPALYLEGPFHSLPILVEARLQRGLPKCQLNGLNGSNSKETIDRIRNAIHATDVYIPHMSLSLNLSPVDVRKSGAYLDLALAVSILLALSESLPDPNAFLFQTRTDKTLYLGELGLSGEVRPVAQLHTLLWEARKQGFARVVLPREQYFAARLIPNIEPIPLSHLQELLQTKPTPNPQGGNICIQTTRPRSNLKYLNLSPRVQKALALCAAGWHSLLLIGPPGSGKSSVAREVLSLLPLPSPLEAIEILVGKDINPGLESQEKAKGLIKLSRPLRAPHHSSTRRAMIGGSSPIQPGEATRAHNGVLILDELGEFLRESLQALREPLQERKIQISRGAHSLSLPARFLLCATTNPCPCGDLSNRYVRCACTDISLKNYMSKFMGALRDRIDLEVWVERKNGEPGSENDFCIKDFTAMIARAHEIQNKRFWGTGLAFNADIAAKDLEEYIPLKDAEAKKEWRQLNSSSQISYRALAGIRRLARTLADLETADTVRAQDLLEAASFRCLESIWR